jgi:hypothetical protein
VFVFGFAVMVAPAFLALKRRRLWRLMPLLPLLPFYYVLVSAAAWRAAWELMHDPFRWNKTDHGGAQTSRSGSPIGSPHRAAQAERGTTRRRTSADPDKPPAITAASEPRGPSRRPGD